MTHSDDVIITVDKRQIKISPIINIDLCLIYGSSAKYNDRQHFRVYGIQLTGKNGDLTQLFFC